MLINKYLKVMLKSHLFCVKFEIELKNNQSIMCDEVYDLVYRTEEWNDKVKFSRTSLHISNAIKAICKDLNVNSWQILIKDIYKIHNHLIID